MTVRELIRKLEEMPQDAPIMLEVMSGYVGYVEVKTSTDNPDIEIYETSDDVVCIQAIN
jgi:hypothetical protein